MGAIILGFFLGQNESTISLRINEILQNMRDLEKAVITKDVPPCYGVHNLAARNQPVTASTQIPVTSCKIYGGILKKNQNTVI